MAGNWKAPDSLPQPTNGEVGRDGIEALRRPSGNSFAASSADKSELSVHELRSWLKSLVGRRAGRILSRRSYMLRRKVLVKL
jgi:hypothetical protein